MRHDIILLNLLGNAIKFTETGTVSVRVHELHECHDAYHSATHPLSNSPTHPIRNIRFQVEDTGVGIPPEKLREIFWTFHRVDATQMYTEGTGLGLAISQRFVRMMGSELHVESTIGQGSTFWFDLEFTEVPGIVASVLSGVDEGAGRTPAKPYRQIIGFKGETRNVLLVDDNADNRKDQGIAETGSEHATLVLPSPADLQTLFDLADRRLVFEVRSWLDHLDQRDAKFLLFSTTIRQLSRSFQFREIGTLLKNYLEDTHEP